MTFDVLITLVRRYAAAAQRKHKSYASAVAHAQVLHSAYVDTLNLPEDTKTAMKNAAAKAVDYEYGRVDHEWIPF